MYGSHLSIAGGLHNALIEAKNLDMQCVQIFTKNQRQWNCKSLTNDQINTWQQHRKSTKIKTVISHDSYLINMASANDETREKSINLFRDEIQRCETLDIQYLVIHPGAHLGQGEEAGLTKIAKGINHVHKSLPNYKTLTLLEITAGQGTNLGYKFEHLKSIIEQTNEPERLAVCLDTAHMIAAGYDLTSEKGAKQTLKQLKATFPIELVKVIHVNDSKAPLASRVDRHQHIGHGHIHLDAFNILLKNPHIKKIPKILETPKTTNDHGVDWDIININTLKSLQNSNSSEKIIKKTKKTPNSS